MRQDAAVTDKVLDRIVGKPAHTSATLQQTLRLICVAGGSTGGRFAVKNTTPDAVELTFKCDFGSEVTNAARARPDCVVTPDRVALKPGEGTTLRLDMDFGRCEAVAAMREFAVEGLAGENVMMRMWVEVEMVE